MYLCVDCGKLFEEPKDYFETHGFMSRPYETWSGCPHCGGAYVETIRCDVCGKWITGEYVELNDGDKICDECYTLMDIMDSLM
jgi:formylmethanofuran dehydrogenase subunit E